VPIPGPVLLEEEDSLLLLLLDDDDEGTRSPMGPPSTPAKSDPVLAVLE
jgi:hypothetical protein